jgi:hypothetical protein
LEVWCRAATGTHNTARKIFDIIHSMKTAKGKSSAKTCSAKAPASKGGVPSVSESGEVVKFNEADMPIVKKGQVRRAKLG